jgi:hypothetical protein
MLDALGARDTSSGQDRSRLHAAGHCRVGPQGRCRISDDCAGWLSGSNSAVAQSGRSTGWPWDRLIIGSAAISVWCRPSDQDDVGGATAFLASLRRTRTRSEVWQARPEKHMTRVVQRAVHVENDGAHSFGKDHCHTLHEDRSQPTQSGEAPGRSAKKLR